MARLADSHEADNDEDVRFLVGGIMRLMISVLAAFCAAVTVSAQAQEKSPTPDSQPAVIRPKSNPIPDKFVNLQVLPKDIGKPQLVGVMKQFCLTFNVRCLYCHTVSDDLTQGRFDSDEKETKRKARELFERIYELRTIRTKDVSQVPGRPGDCLTRRGERTGNLTFRDLGRSDANSTTSQPKRAPAHRTDGKPLHGQAKDNLQSGNGDW